MLQLEDLDKGTFREILMRFWRVFKSSTQKELLSNGSAFDSAYQMVIDGVCRNGTAFIKLDTKLLYEPAIGLSVEAMDDAQGRKLLRFFIDLDRLRKDVLDTELTVKYFDDVIDSYLLTRGIGIYGNDQRILSLTDRLASSGNWLDELSAVLCEIQEKANKQHEKSSLSCEVFQIMTIRIKIAREMSARLVGVKVIPDEIKKILPEIAAMETIVGRPYFS